MFSVDSTTEGTKMRILQLQGREANPYQNAELEPKQQKPAAKTPREPGAMSRRLEQATEDALLTGGSAGRRAIEDAGFSEELKEKLLDKVKDAKFRSQFAGALAQADMSPAAGAGTRGIASAQPWAGEEATGDTVLRMLDDAHKPLKPGSRGRFEPPPVDMRLKREPAPNSRQRMASARDRAQMYAGMGIKESKGLNEREKEDLRKEFRERFSPGARSMPNSLAGLAALANERIEDAIARGQFKNIPRGKGIERDTRADNPFIDTTEYIMNKMIQRQEIVPPWIEKQQDITKQLQTFRARLRNDWKRHAARMISSKGGSLLEQMHKAEQYAKAEKVHNPRVRNVDQIPVPAYSSDEPVMFKVRQQMQETAEAAAKAPEAGPGEALPPPFRDLEWETAENAYMTLAIDNLNSMTRAYNLMAPDLAKKPYFSLQRELASCFADVAPQLAKEIKERATRPKQTAGFGAMEKPATSIMDHFRGGDNPKVHVEAEEKAYGFREWWRDVWGSR
ncbi:hypothetical protein ACO1O0_006127 [Amphichorda felina]